ncbi:NADH-quinone oxidoreductase subunit J family protein [Puia dinghuensis]|uniref:NADH-quinone oxidoreductase subunit J n=1 Tax=Puia dinghuensis TaxID=1792502 RepID=A0A8J2UID7_9BACT|nr:NADH-quinone oxidoreductase subunit J [Puia dinghuensis]GGB22247.1 NADH dehydrogenase subunit J [Puia dinghuensis]
MNASAVVFYILSAFILATGLLAVTSRKIFRTAIWLLFSLTGVAGLYFWLGMQFIAAVQVVVYVGGIVVLIIFSIFLTQQSGKDLPSPLRRRTVFSALAACIGFALTCLLLSRYSSFRVKESDYDFAPDMSISAIGNQLLSTSEHGYVLPFEVISILLLAAMIGCIVIAMKSKPGDK